MFRGPRTVVNRCLIKALGLPFGKWITWARWAASGRPVPGVRLRRLVVTTSGRLSSLSYTRLLHGIDLGGEWGGVVLVVVKITSARVRGRSNGAVLRVKAAAVDEPKVSVHYIRWRLQSFRLVKRAFPRPVPIVKTPHRETSCMNGISLSP